MNERLSSLKFVRNYIKQHRLPVRKKYGQNFLVDENILQKIVLAADVQAEDNVLEIGPGLGTMTRELALHAKHVWAVEIDTMLEPILAETLGGYDNISVVFDDALKVDIPALVGEQGFQRVVANLPYYITTPLLERLLDLHPTVSRMVVLVQREVGERLQATPGSKAYGSLSIWAQAMAHVEMVDIVSRNVFYPVPQVESAIVMLSPYSEAEHGILNRKCFELTNRAIFNQRRKTLGNALKNSPHWQLQPSIIASALQEAGLDAQVRGEQLHVAQVVTLANILTPALLSSLSEADSHLVPS